MIFDDVFSENVEEETKADEGENLVMSQKYHEIETTKKMIINFPQDDTTQLRAVVRLQITSSSSCDCSDIG